MRRRVYYISIRVIINSLCILDMKKKILKGTDTEQKVKRQEEEIQKAKEELDREYREEKKLQNVLDEKEKRTFKLQQKYESNQAQADDLTEKIQLVSPITPNLNTLS